MLKVMDNGAGREADEQGFELDEIARAGARRMLMAALETEAAAYVERHRDQRDDAGRALVVHNGRAPPRTISGGLGISAMIRSTASIGSCWWLAMS